LCSRWSARTEWGGGHAGEALCESAGAEAMVGLSAVLQLDARAQAGVFVLQVQSERSNAQRLLLFQTD